MKLLEITNLTKTFGGLTANDNISFTVNDTEILGLIGPNGAGKTTLFNCISGHLPITSGRIVFDSADITALSSHATARRGMARTFQVYAAVGDLTVLENVMVGCFMHTRLRSQAERRARRIVAQFNLTPMADSQVRQLPVAAQKRVTMATAIGTRPKLLLLDEVAAGLNPSEINEITDFINHIHHQMGISVILIEHVMALVMNISRRVVVLNYGQKIAEGRPDEIIKNPNVIQAYLGRRYAAAQEG